MAAYEVLLLNTAIPQIQAAQTGDTYVVPRDIAFSAALTLSAGTANGVPYLNGSKVVTTGSALQFDGSNLGLGRSPVAYSSFRVLDVAGSAGAIQKWIHTGSTVELQAYASSTLTAVGSATNHPLLLVTNDAERGRFTAGGDFVVSSTGTPLTTGTKLTVSGSHTDWIAGVTNTNASPRGLFVGHNTDSNGTANWFLYCEAGGSTQRMSVRSNGGIANYQSNNVDLSDIRTKTDINPLGSYWNKIAALEIVTYKYKDQTHDDLNIGVIAQQVEQVAPEFVDPDGFGKETPEDGVPLKTIYNKDLTFAAIKALQEAMARIETLEAEVAALKGA